MKVSIPAIIMQMAAIKEFGKADYAHYDPYTVSLTHPDGVIALLSGKTEITAHFTSPPFHQRERKDPKVRTITTSNEIMGGPSTFTMLYAPAKFYDENPKAYAAVLKALQAAIAFINADKKAAAEVFLDIGEGKGWKLDDLMEVLNDPDIRFTTSPENLMTYANFMADVGSIKNAAAKLAGHVLPGHPRRAGQLRQREPRTQRRGMLTPPASAASARSAHRSSRPSAPSRPAACSA